MAVKATDQITLAVGVDVSSVDNYYKLQASSANPPTKPTTANPTGWSTTEPTYDGTTTNTLYICIKTTLTDNTFYWSAVSVSSSYEAAKQATNLANAANTLATAINNYFWHDSAGAHVGTVEGEAHTSTAGYNMTLGATNSNVGIVLEHNADILASFTAQALQFYADGLLRASYNSNGALLYATVNALAAVVAAFTASGVSFYDGNGITDNNILAAFTNSGAQIGKSSGIHIFINANGVDIIDGALGSMFNMSVVDGDTAQLITTLPTTWIGKYSIDSGPSELLILMEENNRSSSAVSVTRESSDGVSTNSASLYAEIVDAGESITRLDSTYINSSTNIERAYVEARATGASSYINNYAEHITINSQKPVVIEYKDVTISSTSAQTNFLTSVSVAKSGYTPTAVVGKYFTSGTRQNFLNDWGTHLEGNTLYVRLCNVHASQSASGTYRVQIEYHRNEML